MVSYSDLSPEAHDLVLFAENEEPIQRQEESIYKNLDRKKFKGIFDRQKAAKLFRYETDAAARAYMKQYGASYRGGRLAPSSLFSTKVRQEAAEFLAKMYDAEYPSRWSSGLAWRPKKATKTARRR